MTLRVKVIPRSAKSEIVGEMADGTLKVKIAAPPEQIVAEIRKKLGLA